MATPHPMTASTIVLPHFERTVPLLFGSDGRPMVPIFALCRMLGLDTTRELRRAQRVLLWDAASLLPMAQGREVWCVWCLPYPLHVGYWFGQVYGHVHDPKLRKHLLCAIKDTDHLAGRLFRHLHDRFIMGRQRMSQLPLSLSSVCDLIEQLQDDRRVQVSESTREHVAALALRHQALRDQAETFVRGWFAGVRQLPVVDAFQVDEEGHVIGAPTPFTLFGVFSHEDSSQLSQYEHAIAALRAELSWLAAGLDDV